MERSTRTEKMKDRGTAKENKSRRNEERDRGKVERKKLRIQMMKISRRRQQLQKDKEGGKSGKGNI